MPGGDSTDLDQEGGSWKTLRPLTRLCAMPHKQEKSLGKISTITSFQLSDHPTTSVAILLIFMCGCC